MNKEEDREKGREKKISVERLSYLQPTALGYFSLFLILEAGSHSVVQTEV